MAVDYKEQPELPRPGSPESFAGIAGGASLAYNPPEEKPHELLLLAKVTSATDFSRFSDVSTLGLESNFCERPNANVLLSLPYIFSQGHDIRLSPPAPIATDDDGKSGPLFTYDLYFHVSLRATSPSQPQEESFDLRTQPEDICFKIVRGAYRALGYSSNVVTIPKESITAALDRYQSGQRDGF